MNKEPAKIRATIEIEFDTLTTNRESIEVMIREKFYPSMRDKITIKQFHISSYGDFTAERSQEIHH